MIRSVILFSIFLGIQVQGYFVRRLYSEEGESIAKRATDGEILQRIQVMGSLNFDTTVVPAAVERRKIACFFVFDKEASDDLNNNIQIAQSYATQLAALATRYMAHANIAVTNAGVELWTSGDRISFAIGSDPNKRMEEYLLRFQTYLGSTQAGAFGTQYAVGVLISFKPTLVSGGYSQGPPCTTSGASVIHYRPMPWTIGGLLAHELAHTLSVVHPFDLSYLCQGFPSLSFCSPSGIPANCTCASAEYPPEQCLMTFSFGRARTNAPRYTPCDIEMMNRFASNIACLIR